MLGAELTQRFFFLGHRRASAKAPADHEEEKVEVHSRIHYQGVVSHQKHYCVCTYERLW
jgi:hypothetical protein